MTIVLLDFIRESCVSLTYLISTYICTWYSLEAIIITFLHWVPSRNILARDEGYVRSEIDNFNYDKELSLFSRILV